MKKTLMLISERSKHILEASTFLRHSQIDVVHIDNVNDAKTGLKMHSPAFVLLNFYIKGSKFLLSAIASGQWFPQPYVMVATDYTNPGSKSQGMKHLIPKLM